MKNKMDLRVRRTKKLIIESFLYLLEQKDFETITIQEIADRAMINRATFYAHYRDKQDLFDQLMTMTIDSFAAILQTDTLIEGNALKMRRVAVLLTKVFKTIKDNRQFFITLTEGSAALVFRAKLIELLSQQYQDIFAQLHITENEMEVPIDFIIEYMISIFTGTVHWWVHSTADFPPDQMARLVIKLVGNGHLTVLGIEIDVNN